MVGPSGTVRLGSVRVATLGPWSVRLWPRGAGVVGDLTAPVHQGAQQLEQAGGWTVDIITATAVRWTWQDVTRTGPQTWTVRGIPSMEEVST